MEICRAGIERLKARGFDAEHIHRTDRTGYKAGALENGTRFAKGEYLLILDADFVPNPDLLQKTIHYFTDDKIGMIQTRWGHLNRTFNVLTRIQAMFLDGHLELEQTARNRSGRFFTFNGTGGIWRKSCIADAGGWEHDTLTEDMDLSYRAQLKGWRFIFLNDVETPAELPVDMDGFKSQQHRWTKGSIQVCKKVLPAIWQSRRAALHQDGGHRPPHLELRLPAAHLPVLPDLSEPAVRSRISASSPTTSSTSRSSSSPRFR